MKNKRLSKHDLNEKFVNGLDTHVLWHSDLKTSPLLLDLQPRKLQLRVYLWNCTNPPGGRALDEYKINVILPGQKPHTRARLDYSEGRTPIIAALIRDGDDEVFALWDADMHDDFSYSANMQVKADVIIRALCARNAETIRHNSERIICARPEHLYDAVIRRMDIMQEQLLEGD